MEKKSSVERTEKEIQRFWEENGIYRFDAGRGGEVWSIDTPPPTVSGSLHIGHVFSYAQAEMIARYRRMRGFNVFYPFGFDDNGLPTERLVEREEGIKAGDVPKGEFVEKCLRTTQKYIREFRNCGSRWAFPRTGRCSMKLEDRWRSGYPKGRSSGF